MRILAIDPGDKRIGMAISDPTGTIANPLGVVEHLARAVDAARIADMAREHEAGLIVVGQALDAEGQVGPQARKAQRLADAIKEQTEIPIILWDESGSTRMAQSARFQMGVVKSKRKGHLDDIAATVILQSYLDAHSPRSEG